MHASSALQVEAFFDPRTGGVSYLVLDRRTLDCAVIDAEPDPGGDRPARHRRPHTSADRLTARLAGLGARLSWILQTHVHGGSLQAACRLRAAAGGLLATGAAQATATSPAPFDRLLADGEVLAVGQLQLRVLHTPGHTPGCTSYVFSDGGGPLGDTAAFVGDALWMPDLGTARCDHPGGCARTLFRSINRLLSLPQHTPLYVGHDFAPAGRELRFACSVQEQRQHNLHVRNGISEEAFVNRRQALDAACRLSSDTAAPS